VFDFMVSLAKNLNPESFLSQLIACLMVFIFFAWVGLPFAIWGIKGRLDKINATLKSIEKGGAE